MQNKMQVEKGKLGKALSGVDLMRMLYSNIEETWKHISEHLEIFLAGCTTGKNYDQRPLY